MLLTKHRCDLCKKEGTICVLITKDIDGFPADPDLCPYDKDTKPEWKKVDEREE